MRNDVFQPVAGAQVAIVGTRLSTLTADDGGFELTGGIRLPATVRVTKEGYAAEMRAAAGWPVCGPGNSFPCDPTRTNMFFILSSVGPSVDVSGEYAVTLTADSACHELPAEARTRTFTASIVPNTPAGTRYFVTVHSPSMESQLFDAGVLGDALVMKFQSFDVPPGIIDAITPTRYVLSDGIVSTQVTPGASLISAAFDGSVAYCSLKVTNSSACTPDSSVLADPTPADPRPFTSCRSANHRIELRRR